MIKSVENIINFKMKTKFEKANGKLAKQHMNKANNHSKKLLQT